MANISDMKNQVHSMIRIGLVGVLFSLPTLVIGQQDNAKKNAVEVVDRSLPFTNSNSVKPSSINSLRVENKNPTGETASDFSASQNPASVETQAVKETQSASIQILPIQETPANSKNDSAQVLPKVDVLPKTISAKTTPDIPMRPIAHWVKKGDTAYSVAFRYGLDVRQLAEWNQLDAQNKIKIGQRLRLLAPNTTPISPSSLASNSDVPKTTRTQTQNELARLNARGLSNVPAASSNTNSTTAIPIADVSNSVPPLDTSIPIQIDPKIKASMDAAARARDLKSSPVLPDESERLTKPVAVENASSSTSELSSSSISASTNSAPSSPSSLTNIVKPKPESAASQTALASRTSNTAARAPDPIGNKPLPIDTKVQKNTAPQSAEVESIIETEIKKSPNEKPENLSLREDDLGASHEMAGLLWFWPTKGRVVGTYVAGNPVQQGIDIQGAEGQVVRAAANGEVVYSGNGLVGYGELVIVKHSSEYLSAYGHNRKRLVVEGDKVKAGQAIAELGGRDGVLHFEIRKFGKPIDPRPFLAPQ